MLASRRAVRAGGSSVAARAAPAATLRAQLGCLERVMLLLYSLQHRLEDPAKPQPKATGVSASKAPPMLFITHGGGWQRQPRRIRGGLQWWDRTDSD